MYNALDVIFKTAQIQSRHKMFFGVFLALFFSVSQASSSWHEDQSALQQPQKTQNITIILKVL